MQKGIWVILRRISSSYYNKETNEFGEWQAHLALTDTPCVAPIAKSPEMALKLFEVEFIDYYQKNLNAYNLQTLDDYPDGITEYAVRFIPISIPLLQIVSKN